MKQSKEHKEMKKKFFSSKELSKTKSGWRIPIEKRKDLK